MDISGMLRSGGLLPNPSRSGGQTVLDGPAGGLDPAGAGDLISNSASPELAACRWRQTVSKGGGGRPTCTLHPSAESLRSAMFGGSVVVRPRKSVGENRSCRPDRNDFRMHRR